MSQSRHITDKEIEDGLALLACLIDWYGDVYWPVFERLEAELARRRLRAERLNKRRPKSFCAIDPKGFARDAVNRDAFQEPAIEP